LGARTTGTNSTACTTGVPAPLTTAHAPV